jgi:PTS system N-acetylglucosamine-specific IIC component
VRLGFSFSAGLFDYLINFGQATRPWWLLPVGLVYAVAYYAGFRFFIRRYALTTPGREVEAPVAIEPASGTDRARAMIRALGGAANLHAVDACTTRLRLEIANQSAVDEAALRALGARGFVRPSAELLQVVLGPIADQVAGELRAVLREVGSTVTATVKSPPDQWSQPVPWRADADFLARLLAALGGRENVARLEGASTRVMVTLRDAAFADNEALRALRLRGIAQPMPTSLHLVIGPDAGATLHGLRRLIESPV